METKKMIYTDFRNTYKSFLFLLCGMLLAVTAGAGSGLALGIGLLLYFVPPEIIQ